MNLILALAVSSLFAGPAPKNAPVGDAKGKPQQEEKAKKAGPMACLEEHEDELSDSCKTFIEEREEKQEKAVARLNKVCGGEIMALCKDLAKPVELRKCLLDNSDKLQDKCAKWAERAKAHQPKPGEKKPKGPNKLKEACGADLEKLCPKKGKKDKQAKP